MTSNVQYLSELRTRCTHIRSGSDLVTDAPVDNNGKGETFSPTDLVATALASCMITVMGIKAAQSDISFSNVSAQVLKVMDSKPRRISEIKVVIDIQEGWTSKEKAIMEKTGLNCPVAKSLSENLKQDIVFNYK